MNGGSSPPRTTCARIRQIGSAARLKPECLLASIPGTARRVVLGTWLGRQSADHPGLEPGMLWVRLPPEPLATNTSSWSSQECSPRCQRGGRGFKSRRGRFFVSGDESVSNSKPSSGRLACFAIEYEKARYANRQSGQAQTLVIVGSTPTCATLGCAPHGGL
jgi:hypothetical protein